MEEAELSAVFAALCEKYGLNVLINPSSFQINSPAAIDVEHDEQGNLVGIGVFDGSGSLYFTEVSECLRAKLLDIQLIAHNGKGDFDSLRQWGIPLSDSQLIWDTELISHIIDSSRKGYGLKKLAKEDLGFIYPSYEDLVGKRTSKIRRTLNNWPISIVSLYNACDVYATFKLYEFQTTQIQAYL